MLKLYIIGICILIIAIIANGIITKLGILSWYDFIKLISNKGLSALKSIGIISYVWLFIGYPLALGLGYLLGAKIYQSIFA